MFCLFHAENLHIRGLFVNSQIWLVKTLACPFIFIHCLIERFNDIQKKIVMLISMEKICNEKSYL